MSQKANAFRLRIDLRDETEPNYPIVTVLINGKDILGHVEGGFIGFDPAEVLDTGALVPTDPPRRVAVYRCSCGEPGCGCLAPVVTRHGDRVVWSDFRDFTGVYNKPLYGDGNPSGGTPRGIPDLEFSSAQYLEEVTRATEDRSWESDARATARILSEMLKANVQHFISQGYEVGWVGPHWDSAGSFQAYFTNDRGDIPVILTPKDGSPQEQAEEMASTLLTQPPDNWPIEK